MMNFKSVLSTAAAALRPIVRERFSPLFSPAFRFDVKSIVDATVALGVFGFPPFQRGD
jgi:hypothetical protein